MTRKQRHQSEPPQKKPDSCPPGNSQAHRALSLGESFSYAWCGVRYFFRTQRNARIHLLAAVVTVAVGVFVGLTISEMAVILVVIGVVFMAEMFNTALEAVIDLATEEWNPLAKVAKDVGAAAVLVTAIVAAVVGLLIFVPHFVETIARFTPLP